jgi:hypothetical protein
MPVLFNPVITELHTAESNSRQIRVEPIVSLGITPDGWQGLGIYDLYDDEGPLGRLIFKNTAWTFDGFRLTETEQEELAYFIRFYNGAA